jgi:hypothetical protein
MHQLREKITTAFVNANQRLGRGPTSTAPVWTPTTTYRSRPTTSAQCLERAKDWYLVTLPDKAYLYPAVDRQLTAHSSKDRPTPLAHALLGFVVEDLREAVLGPILGTTFLVAGLAQKLNPSPRRKLRDQIYSAEDLVRDLRTIEPDEMPLATRKAKVRKAKDKLEAAALFLTKRGDRQSGAELFRAAEHLRERALQGDDVAALDLVVGVRKRLFDV